MTREDIYRSLEDKMLTYADLSLVPVRPVSEDLVAIDRGGSIDALPVNDDMQPYTGDRIYVRESILSKLEAAAKLLTRINPEMKLQVVYGYRALSIQQKLFFSLKNQLTDSLSEEALMEAAHRFVAVPDVAGHPTGGAVDIQIIYNGSPLDMGTEIWELVKDSYVFSPFIGRDAQSNRLLLRSLMLAVGFAPFDGEWWHFSYGDKEWAKYYGKPFAIYEQINFSVEREAK